MGSIARSRNLTDFSSLIQSAHVAHGGARAAVVRSGYNSRSILSCREFALSKHRAILLRGLSKADWLRLRASLFGR